MIGEVFSHYRIVGKLGEGGMGEVFLAQDTSLDRKVAIKILPEGFRLDAVARKRFLQEARLAAALDHPYICSIHELLDAGGQHCIVMEYIEGETLRARLARGAIPRHDALRMGLEIVEALEKAHQKGIIHRDLKPANIMLTPEGHVKVMDFGLARQIEVTGELALQETRSSFTRQGTTVGTLAYMSPEQVQGHPLTAASDLFALGIVLCEMLTGVHPFHNGVELATIHAIIHAKPAFPPSIPDDDPRLLSTLLAKEPHERDSLHDLRSCLAGALQEAESGSRPVAHTLASSLRRAIARPWVSVAAALVILGGSYLAYYRIEHNRRTECGRLRDYRHLTVSLPEAVLGLDHYTAVTLAPEAVAP